MESKPQIKLVVNNPTVTKLLEVGGRWGWKFRVLGQAPFPDEPIRLSDWLIVPTQLDTCQIPDETMRKVQAIYQAGLNPKGFVVVHEAPRLLPAHAGEVFTLQPVEENQIQKWVLSGLGIAGLVLAAVTGLAVLAFVFVLLSALVLAPLALIASAAAIDPILVAVIEEDVWVEIDRWDLSRKESV